MKKLIGYSLILLATAVYATGCSGDKKENAKKDSTVVVNPAKNTPPDSLLLVPGVSAGILEINGNADSLYHVLGKPDDGDAAMQKAVAIWYYHHDPKSYATSVYSARDTGEQPIARIQQIRITNPAFQTKEFIGVGSEITEISKIIPVQELPDYKQQDKETALFDSLKGISFEVNADGICTAVIIHKAGEALKGTYLTFR